jgi:hypothetical protein
MSNIPFSSYPSHTSLSTHPVGPSIPIHSPLAPQSPAPAALRRPHWRREHGRPRRPPLSSRRRRREHGRPRHPPLSSRRLSPPAVPPHARTRSPALSRARPRPLLGQRRAATRASRCLTAPLDLATRACSLPRLLPRAGRATRPAASRSSSEAGGEPPPPEPIFSLRLPLLNLSTGGSAGKGRTKRETQRAKLLFSAASSRFGSRERLSWKGRKRFGGESVFLIPLAQLCQKQLLKLLLKLCQRDPEFRHLSIQAKSAQDSNQHMP